MTEQKKRQRDLEIWRRDDEFIALRRSVYRGDVGRRRKGGWRRGKSDRLDYESTHRRTLFNVSLTFLFSISSPPTLSRWRQMGRKEKPRERAREGERGRDATLCLYFTQGHQSQTKSRVRVHGRASQSGGGEVRESGFLLHLRATCSMVSFRLFLIDHLFISRSLLLIPALAALSPSPC